MDDAVREFFQTIEAHFVERRGRPLLLSPDDVARVTAWHRAGIPLLAAIEGIDIHFDRMKRRGKESRRAVTLAFVEDDVQDAWLASKQRRLGRSRDGSEASEPAGGLAEHARFVEALEQALARLAPGDDAAQALIPALQKSLARLRDKMALFDPATAGHDDQRTEDHLRRLEKSLLEAAREALGPEALAALEADVDRYLADKADKMKADALARVRVQLLDRKLRERFFLPRLSLFYT